MQVSDLIHRLMYSEHFDYPTLIGNQAVMQEACPEDSETASLIKSRYKVYYTPLMWRHFAWSVDQLVHLAEINIQKGISDLANFIFFCFNIGSFLAILQSSSSYGLFPLYATNSCLVLLLRYLTLCL